MSVIGSRHGATGRRSLTAPLQLHETPELCDDDFSRSRQIRKAVSDPDLVAFAFEGASPAERREFAEEIRAARRCR